jgi:hypothetical protein
MLQTQSGNKHTFFLLVVLFLVLNYYLYHYYLSHHYQYRAFSCEKRRRRGGRWGGKREGHLRPCPSALPLFSPYSLYPLYSEPVQPVQSGRG